MASMAYPTQDNQYRGGAACMTASSRNLSLIDTVEINRIVKRGGHSYFVLSVYQHNPQQNTKLTLISPAERFFRTRQVDHDVERRGEPEFQVKRRFSEFVELRHTLRSLASAAHANVSVAHNVCGFCRPLLEFLNHDRKCPRSGLQLILISRTQMEYLSSFIRRVIMMVVHASVSSSQPQHHHQQHGNCCDVIFQAAMVLGEFLQKPRQSLSLGII